MVNVTPTYWSAKGESLHTFARSIESLGPGLRAAMLRGENVTIPGRPGKVWTEKDIDSRTLPLGMWVRGNDQIEFQNNWNDLVRLLWTPGEQFELTKRFYDRDSTLRSASALAEFASGLEPTMIGRSGAKTMVELDIANAFFFDDDPQVFPLVDGDQTINIRGNAPTRNISIVINGARKNTIIRRKSPSPDHQVQVTTDLNSSDFSTIDIANYEATTKRGTTPAYDSSVEVRHTGSKAWLELKPGDNVINVSSVSGIGSIQMTVRGAWL